MRQIKQINGELYFLFFIHFMLINLSETSLAWINPREDKIDVGRIQRMMDFGDQLITPGKNTTEVIFLGPMRSGKSTLMSLFGGSFLYSIGSTKKTYSIDSKGDPEDIMTTKNTQIYKQALKEMEIQDTDRTISSEGVACTVIPMRTAGFAEAISYWDTPGFGDDRGVQFDLLNGYFIKKVFDINQQVSTKLCLVISFHQLQVATGSKTLVPALRQFHKTFSGIPNYFDSLMVVVTATKPDQDIESVIAHLKDFKNNFEQKDSPKELYNYIIAHRQILLLMKEPIAQKQDIRPYYEQFINSFYKTIEQIKPLESSNIVTPISEIYLEQINQIISKFKYETINHIYEFIKAYETEFQKAAFVEQKVQIYKYSDLEERCNYLKIWRSYNYRLRQLVKAELDGLKLREIRKKFDQDFIKLLEPTKKSDNDGIISFLDLLQCSTINTTNNNNLLSLIKQIKNKFIALRFLSMTTLKGNKRFQAPNPKSFFITQFIDKIKSSLNNKITKLDENCKIYIYDYLKFFTPLKITSFLEQFKRDSYYGKWRQNGEFLTNFMYYVSTLNSPGDKLDDYIKKIDDNKGYFGFQQKAQSLQQLSKTVYLIRDTVGNSPEKQTSLTQKCKDIFFKQFLVKEMDDLSKYRPSKDHLEKKIRLLPPYYKNDMQHLNGDSSAIQKNSQKITSQNASLDKEVTKLKNDIISQKKKFQSQKAQLDKEVTKLKKDLISQKKKFKSQKAQLYKEVTNFSSYKKKFISQKEQLNELISQKNAALQANKKMKDFTCCNKCGCIWIWCCIF